MHFSIQINAPRERVWDVMLGDATYRIWTNEFNPSGSHYEGDWSKGSKMFFLGPDPQGSSIGGMVSTIEENKPYEYISIKHLGMINNGVEDTTSDVVKDWVGAMENYTFREYDGGTELLIDTDVTEKEEANLGQSWLRALQRLKELCEN